MHVYTPPGYERNNDKYPVFYLLHGAGDSDDSWSSVGRAGLHPRQSDRRQEGQADDHRDAGRAHAPRRRGRRRDRTDGDRRIRQGIHRRHHAVHREELPRADRSQQHGHRGPLDGRRPHAARRHPAPRSVRLHRRLQLRPSRRVPRTRRRPRGAAPPAAPVRQRPQQRPRPQRRQPPPGCATGANSADWEKKTPRRSTTPGSRRDSRCSGSPPARTISC